MTPGRRPARAAARWRLRLRRCAPCSCVRGVHAACVAFSAALGLWRFSVSAAGGYETRRQHKRRHASGAVLEVRRRGARLQRCNGPVGLPLNAGRGRSGRARWAPWRPPGCRWRPARCRCRGCACAASRSATSSTSARGTTLCRWPPARPSRACRCDRLACGGGFRACCYDRPTRSGGFQGSAEPAGMPGASMGWLIADLRHSWGIFTPSCSAGPGKRLQPKRERMRHAVALSAILGRSAS